MSNNATGTARLSLFFASCKFGMYHHSQCNIPAAGGVFLKVFLKFLSLHFGYHGS
jgi:hypothetical protein